MTVIFFICLVCMSFVAQRLTKSDDNSNKNMQKLYGIQLKKEKYSKSNVSIFCFQIILHSFALIFLFFFR